MTTTAQHYHSKLLNKSGRRIAAVYRVGQYFVPRIRGEFRFDHKFQKTEQCAQFIADEVGQELTWMEPQS